MIDHTTIQTFATGSELAANNTTLVKKNKQLGFWLGATVVVGIIIVFVITRNKNKQSNE